jgi:hypothetical protein
LYQTLDDGWVFHLGETVTNLKDCYDVPSYLATPSRIFVDLDSAPDGDGFPFLVDPQPRKGPNHFDIITWAHDRQSLEETEAQFDLRFA